jgi:hypothetical protein
MGPLSPGETVKHLGEDRAVFTELIRTLDQGEASSETPGRLVLRIGAFFLGRPYRAETLESKKVERLVLNLRELDCVTFVENVVALTWLGRSRQKSFDAFRRLLREIRYRQGRLRGYASRLHYFSDWIYDNEKKGIVKDVTEEIGGRPFHKAVSFMTTHPELYPPLKQAVQFRRMRSVEREISRRVLFFISKKDLRRRERGIHDGDLIAITAKTEGLDILHVGFAARVKNRVHLLHASSAEGRVVLSLKTLYRYLMENEARSGIMVARLGSRGLRI